MARGSIRACERKSCTPRASHPCAVPRSWKARDRCERRRTFATTHLLHDETASVYGPTPDWRVWLKLAGYEDVDANHGTRFSHAADALQAAIGGLGVVLGRESLAAADIAAGRLIRPFELTLQTDFAYYLVRPDVAEDRPKVAAFRAWVLEEVRRDDANSSGPP